MAVRVSRIRYQVTDDGATTTIRRLVSENERLKKSVEDLDKRFQSLGASHRRTADASTISLASNKSLAGGLVSVGGAAAAAATALTLVGAASAAVARNAIAANARLQAQRENVRFLVKDAEQAAIALAKLDRLARSPLGDAVYDAFERLVQGGAPLPRALSLIEALGDQVGGNSARFAGASTAISQMFAKGRVSAEELVQQLSEHGVPAVRILREELGLTDKQLENIGKSGRSVEEVVDALERGMRKASGGRMAAMAQGPAGLLASMGAGANRVMARLGNIFEPVTNRVIAGMIQLFERLDKSLERLGGSPEFQQFLNDLIAAGQAVLPILLFIAEHIDDVVRGFIRWGPAIAAVSGPLGMLLSGLWSFVRLLGMLGKVWEGHVQMFKKGGDVLGWLGGLLKTLWAFVPPPIRLWLDENGVGAQLETILKNLSGGGAVKIPVELAADAGQLLGMVSALVLSISAPSIGIPLVISTGAGALSAMLAQRLAEAHVPDKAVSLSVNGSASAMQAIQDVIAKMGELSDRVVTVNADTAAGGLAIGNVLAQLGKIPATLDVGINVDATGVDTVVNNVLAGLGKIPLKISVGISILATGVIGVINGIINALNQIPTKITTVHEVRQGEGEGGREYSSAPGASDVGSAENTGAQVSGTYGTAPTVGSTSNSGGASGSALPSAALAAIAGAAASVIGAIGAGAGASVGGWGGGGGCFAAGTLVETPAGPRPIEQIRAGDLVLALDPQTGLAVARRVVQTFAHEPLPVVAVALADGTRLVATPDHPVWDVDRWIGVAFARSIRRIDADGDRAVAIASVTPLPAPAPVFNLHVEGDERAPGGYDALNYLVAGGFVVHNYLFDDKAHHALGTNYAEGGWSIVGERGPELVNLPKGSQVIPAHRVGEAMGGGGLTVNINLHGGTYASSGALRELAASVMEIAAREYKLTRQVAGARV